MVDDLQFQERIYDLVNGYLDLVHFSIPESAFVKDEFSRGSFCNQAYGKVLDAYANLCSRLHPDCAEDEDVETILNAMNAITKHIAIKMFQYGVFFARREK